MTEDAKLRREIENYTKDQKILSASMVTQNGYCAVLFSPAASRTKTAQDKLAIALTFTEWRQIGELLENESKIPWSPFSSTQFLDFLKSAIRTIPIPDGITKAPEKPNHFGLDDALEDLEDRRLIL